MQINFCRCHAALVIKTINYREDLQFLIIELLIRMSLCLPDRPLMVKLFYYTTNSVAVALRKFRTLKSKRKDALSVKNLRLMITKSEETESSNDRSGRGRKLVSTEEIQKIALQVKKSKTSNEQASISIRHVALNMQHLIVHKIMRNSLRFYPYQFQLVQSLLPLRDQCPLRTIFMQDS